MCVKYDLMSDYNHNLLNKPRKTTLSEENFAGGKFREIKHSRMNHIKMFCEHKLAQIDAHEKH